MFSKGIGIGDSNLAELVAILEALRMLSSAQWLFGSGVVIESDSMVAVSWANGTDIVVWRYLSIYNEIRNLLCQLRSVSVRHISRSSNSVADSLAKFVVDREIPLLVWL